MTLPVRRESRRPSRLAVPALLVTLTAVLFVEAAVASSALAAPAAPSAPVAATTAEPLTLTLGRLSPAALTADTPLVVQGTARNTGATTVKNAKVRLRMHPGTLAGRTAIDDWQSSGTISDSDVVLPGAAKLGALAPGQSASFTITVPKGQSSLSTLSTFGPRGIALEAVTGSKTDGPQVGRLLTTLVWSPPASHPTRTRLSLLVPFTSDTYGENAGAPTAAVAESLEAGGRMNRLLQAASDSAVSWALDPAVLESAQRLATTGEVSSDDAAPASATPTPSTSGTGKSTGGTSSTASEAKQAAAGWLADLRQARGKRTAIGLPYADPDLTSLFRSKKGLRLLRTADLLGKTATKSILGRALDTTVAWPADGEVNSPPGVNALLSGGRTAIVLPASAQPPTTATTSTPTGRSTIRGTGGSLAGLLYDDQLSDLFTASGEPGGSAPAGTTATSTAGSTAGSTKAATTAGATSPAAATQTMLAQLAAISAQVPGESRQVLAVTPRDWSPDPAAVQALLADLRASPWVSLRSVGDLRAATSTTARGEPVSRKTNSKELPIGNVSGATVMINDLDTIAPALSDPSAVVSPLQEEVVSLLSFGWRENRDGLPDARSDVRKNVTTLFNGIQLLVGEKNKTLAAHAASIPVVVWNDTQYPMHVVVDLVPGSGQLSIPATVQVYATAKSRTQVLVPAKAIANGNVTVEGRLLTPKGKQLGPASSFTLKARPDWETGGTIAAGVILGLLLVLGLVRGIGRGRTRIPPQSVPDVDDQASGRRPPEPDQVSEPVDAAAERTTADRGILSGKPPEPYENRESVVTGARGEDFGAPGARDSAGQRELSGPIARAEQRPRAVSETRPATGPAAPGAATAPGGDPHRPASSRETR